MKKIIVFVFLAASLFAAIVSGAAPEPYQRMIVFGDSYSDNGNDFKLSQRKYPNAVRYYQGRFSDGPTWVEYLAQNFKINPHDASHFLNYAYGQAKILSETSITVLGNPAKKYRIPDLAQQIGQYVNQYKRFTDKDLVVIFISTNDFFDVTDLTDKTFFQAMADQETQQIQRLMALGARHFIVLNGRDVTYSPLATIYVCKDPASQSVCLQQFRSLIQAYNQRLKENLKDIKEVFLFDTYTFDNALMVGISNGGFAYQVKSHPYLLTDAASVCYQNLQGDYQGIAGGVCENPQQHFFYDRIHTTKNVSYLMAQSVYEKFLAEYNLHA